MHKAQDDNERTKKKMIWKSIFKRQRKWEESERDERVMSEWEWGKCQGNQKKVTGLSIGTNILMSQCIGVF
jgi:hypothetical protein